MRFVTITNLIKGAAKIIEEVEKKKENCFIVTKKGMPVALIIPFSEGQLEVKINRRGPNDQRNIQKK